MAAAELLDGAKGTPLLHETPLMLPATDGNTQYVPKSSAATDIATCESNQSTFQCGSSGAAAAANEVSASSFSSFSIGQRFLDVYRDWPRPLEDEHVPRTITSKECISAASGYLSAKRLLYSTCHVFQPYQEFLNKS
jgi:hypothetical protein